MKLAELQQQQQQQQQQPARRRHRVQPDIQPENEDRVLVKTMLETLGFEKDIEKAFCVYEVYFYFLFFIFIHSTKH